MKTIKHLRLPWLAGAVVTAIAVGELTATALGRRLHFAPNPLTVAFFCVGAVAFVVSLVYDGND